jgi:type I restriction enzyme S subunit
MHTSRTTAIALDTKRIDPDYYAPVHLADEALIRSKGAVELGSGGRLFAGPFGSELPTSAFVKDGIPLFRVGNIGELEIDERDLACIPESLHAELASSEVRPGDLLVVKASVGEKLCIVPSSLPRANITQHIIGMRPNGLLDMGYAAASLFTSYGRRQLQRRALGALIQYLGVQEARTVLVPRLGDDAQRYIGAKVRQAEILRTWACTSVRLILADYKSVALRLTWNAKRHSRVSGKHLRDRLDAEHYPDDVLQFFQALDPLREATIRSLSEDIFSGSTLSPSEEQTSVLQATVATLGPLFLNDRLRNVAAPRNQCKRLQTHDLAIAAAAHTASYVGRDVTYCVADDQIYPSTEVLVIRPAAGGVSSTWLWCFLKSQLGYRQIQACVRGITAHAYPDDICHVRVPLPEDEVADRFYSHDDTMLHANNATKLAKSLIDSARFLVEALIEGKITEAELIAAGKDADADRALLARLRDDGLDGAGSRLFPDIDALFQLIEQVRGSEVDS